MAIDIAQVVRAALDAATQGSSPQTDQKKSHLPVGRTVLVGAGLVTAGRLVTGSRGRELLGSIQQRIAALEAGHEDEDSDGAEASDDGQYEDEPEAEGDEDFDDEEDFEEDLEAEGEEDSEG